MVLLFDAAPTLPDEVVADRLGLGMQWTDWTGTVWDLRDPTSGVFLTDAGLRGLTMPPLTRYVSTSPAIPGSAWRGVSTGEREVFWPLFLYANGSQKWVDLDRQFWAGLHPVHPGAWTVTQPNGVSRRLQLRFVDDGQPAFGVDPVLEGWAVYGISLVAESPYWEGDAISRSWGPSDAQNYFGGDAGGGYGPPFYITSSASVSTATISNPGDVTAHMRWTVNGPCTNATMGIGSDVITVPFDLDAGEWVSIDTAPDKQVAIDNTGADRTLELGTNTRWGEIPTGASVRLDITLAGTGSVEGALTPQYYRAW